MGLNLRTHAEECQPRHPLPHTHKMDSPEPETLALTQDKTQEWLTAIPSQLVLRWVGWEEGRAHRRVLKYVGSVAQLASAQPEARNVTLQSCQEDARASREH